MPNEQINQPASAGRKWEEMTDLTNETDEESLGGSALNGGLGEQEYIPFCFSGSEEAIKHNFIGSAPKVGDKIEFVCYAVEINKLGMCVIKCKWQVASGRCA